MGAEVLPFFTLVIAVTPGVAVLLPDAETPETCAARARLAGTLSRTPGVRVVRGPAAPDLAGARTAAGTALAIALEVRSSAAEAAPVPGAAPEATLVEVRVASEEGEARASGSSAEAALRAAWPRTAPPLLEGPLADVPSEAALLAACRGEATAYALAGAAAGRLLPALLAPRAEGAKGSRLQGWAEGGTLLARGAARAAITLLEPVLAAIERGEAAPVWRRPPGPEGSPSHLQATAGLMLLFARGTFLALEPETGAERWRLELGRAEPQLVDAGGGLLLALLESEVVAIEARSGGIAWRLPLIHPAAEVALAHDRFYLAGAQEVVAVRRTGEVLWRHDPRTTVVAGPVLAGARLIAPLDIGLEVLDPDRGAPERRINLSDEISGPLLVTPGGAVWALVGSDEIFSVDPESGLTTLQVRNQPGAAGPPLLLGERLVLVAGAPRARGLVYLDPRARGGVSFTQRGVRPPLSRLADFGGVLHAEDRPPKLIARGLEGKPLWQASLPSPMTALEAHLHHVAVAAGRTVLVLDPQRGRELGRVGLDGAVMALAEQPEGAAALLADGTVYGLPGTRDPRPRHWLEEARLELGAARLAAGQAAGALMLAERVLARAPGHLEALALAARASAAQKKRDDAQRRWAELLERAPPGDPLRREAEGAL